MWLRCTSSGVGVSIFCVYVCFRFCGVEDVCDIVCAREAGEWEFVCVWLVFDHESRLYYIALCVEIKFFFICHIEPKYAGNDEEEQENEQKNMLYI